jgi:hypothetical protein
MIDKVNAQGKEADGVTTYPHMFGDQGWYHFTADKYRHGAEEIWYWSMRDADLDRLPRDGRRQGVPGGDTKIPMGMPQRGDRRLTAVYGRGLECLRA